MCENIAPTPLTPTSINTTPSPRYDRKRKEAPEKKEVWLFIVTMDNFSEAYTVPYNLPCVRQLLSIIEHAKACSFRLNGYFNTDAYRHFIDAFFFRITRRWCVVEQYQFALRNPPVCVEKETQYDMRLIIDDDQLEEWEYHKDALGMLRLNDDVVYRDITLLNYYG